MMRRENKRIATKKEDKTSYSMCRGVERTIIKKNKESILLEIHRFVTVFIFFFFLLLACRHLLPSSYPPI